jgi:AcrR family transcriptional regulator
MTTPTTTRADARRNREKLLEAAAAAFAEVGTDVSLEAIAKRAGVGIGTLYRHFPTRDALVEAVYRTEVERLTASAPELLQAHPPDVALEQWMERFVDYAVTKRGLKSALQSVAASRSDLFANTKTELLRALGLILDAGAAARTIRADVAAEDVLRAMSAVWSLDQEPGWDQQARAVLRLLMDGLRYGAG